MNYLTFELSEAGEGVVTLDAMASTSAEQHAAAMAEVEQVLGWAWRNFPYTHGPADDGNDWDHDLQVYVELGRWHVVTLTLSASPNFVEAFFAAHTSARDDAGE